MIKGLITTIVSTVILAGGGAAQAATINVPPGGNLTTAYNNAQAGDTIVLGCGQHTPWTTPSGTKQITIKAATQNCAKMKQLVVSASNITFDGLDLDAGGPTVKPPDINKAVLDVDSVRNLVFKNGRIGNVGGQKGAMLAGDMDTSPHGVVLENNLIHDVQTTSSGDHLECVMSHTPGVTFRDNVFKNCDVYDISLGRGDWWGQPEYGNVTIINNVFGHSTGPSGAGNWHYYGLAWWLTSLNGARVINNTFENEVLMDRATASTNGVWANNIGGGWDCVSGVTYTGNVGEPCSAQDKATNPQFSRENQPQPVGWVDPAAQDFHLTSSSVAINAGSAQYAPATDKDGKARVNAPDSGAYEFGGTPPPPPPSPACSDGIDNDGDGNVDYPNDLGCASPSDDSESPDPIVSYHPQCEPTCDQQITDLKSQVTTLTQQRDSAQAAAQTRLEKLNDIRTVLDR